MKKSAILGLVLMFIFSSYIKSYGQDIVAVPQTVDSYPLSIGVRIIS